MAIATADALAPAPDYRFDYADLVGKPFVLTARGPDAFDCYGLVAEVLARSGNPVPEVRSPEFASYVSKAVTEECARPMWVRCEPGPGAIAVFRIGRDAGHVGVLLPFDKFIHSWDRSGGVCIERTSDWSRRIVGFYRLAATS
jgi:cell wall-associated NlpC family hydrolase